MGCAGIHSGGETFAVACSSVKTLNAASRFETTEETHVLSRIPEGERFSTVIDRLSKLANERNRAQESLSSLKRISAASDDSAGAVRAVALRAEGLLAERYGENALQATQWNEFAGDVLQEVADLLARTRELAINGANSALDGQDRDALADEMDALLEHVVELANTEVAGRSLFGGGSKPPIITPSATTTSGAGAFNYEGNREANTIAVGAGVTVGMGITADQIFTVQDRRPTRYVGGGTGATGGSGTDSASGFGALAVSHTQTTLGDGALAGNGDSVSGLVPGASTASDTVLGAHSIQIFSTGSVALNGGAAVNFTAGDTDLKVVGPDGEQVFLNMSGVAPATPFTVNAQGAGSLSVDGGTSSLAIDFSDNQIVRHSVNGTVTHIDSSAIRKAGNESLTYSGSFGLLGTLAALRDDLRNTRNLNLQDQATELSQHLDEISDAESSLARGFAVVGTAANRASAAENTALDLGLRLEQLRASVEDVDLAEAILTFQRSEMAYEASLRATGQSQSLSLLDYLR
jgi:flagellar hook-associated protein 3 FlgL